MSDLKAAIDLATRLRDDADEIEACGGGNEAGRIRQAAERIAELEAALKPFAKLAEDYTGRDVDFDDATIMAGRITAGPDGLPPRVTFRQFRTAMDVLAKGDPQ